jgi:hypothetical protein
VLLLAGVIVSGSRFADLRARADEGRRELPASS